MAERTMKKRLCVLQVTPSHPNPEHVKFFSGDDCDFYFVTHDDPHEDAMEFCPNTTWTDTRNILAKNVPKNYDYYAFVDYDYKFHPKDNLGVLDQILFDLNKFNPAVLTYYPGKGLITPYADDTEYFNSKDYSVIPFTHCGMKVIHHSLMDWFFPMVTKFGGGVEACHLFNILEIPFLKNVVCSHKMKYDNGVTDLETPHNQNGAWSKYRMDEMWKWISPAFTKSNLLKMNISHPSQFNDSLLVKNFFVDLFRRKKITPEKRQTNNFYDVEKITKFFDLDHERFHNVEQDYSNRPERIDDHDLKIIKEYLEKITFDDLLTDKDPWDNFVYEINSNKKLKYKITTSECVDIYQKVNTKGLFKNCNKRDEELNNYLKGKRVAFVGPAPYLNGQGKGRLIDSYDVIVRIQHDIKNNHDYGSRSDIIQSCLNSNYGPPLVNHLFSVSKQERPKFIICNDTASQLKRDGTWQFIDEVYEKPFQDLGIPFVHLKNSDGTWNRWVLYWEIYAKKHIERFKDNKFTIYSANFNSGYGALNMLLSYDIEELAVFGLDFYNTGLPQTNDQKYNSSYIDTYGNEGTHLGPDKILHDQLAQIMHCRNVLLKDKRLNIDGCVMEKLVSKDVESRINKFIKLPKFKKETR